jgi:D-glycero-D-manno-heptose 1,7-bisphosphate phosphatase
MRALLLDRDGVINQDSADFIRTPAEWRPLPGALQALARACHAGYTLIVVSNQSGLARGLFDVHALNAIHARLLADLARAGGSVDAFFFCPHGPDDGCACRKPQAGLLHALRDRLGLDLHGTPFIGDRLSDAQAALAVGARPMLVGTGLERLDPDAVRRAGPIEVFDDLAAAVAAL